MNKFINLIAMTFLVASCGGGSGGGGSPNPNNTLGYGTGYGTGLGYGGALGYNGLGTSPLGVQARGPIQVWQLQQTAGLGIAPQYYSIIENRPVRVECDSNGVWRRVNVGNEGRRGEGYQDERNGNRRDGSFENGFGNERPRFNDDGSMSIGNHSFNRVSGGDYQRVNGYSGNRR